MPTTIPYDPSLVLGNLVDPESLKALKAVLSIQEPVHKAELEVNSLTQLKQNLEMAVEVLKLENLDSSELRTHIDIIEGQLSEFRDNLDREIQKAEKARLDVRSGFKP